MCNLRTSTYACGHTVAFRLSTCLGSFTRPAGGGGRKPHQQTQQRFPLCSATPWLSLRSEQNCGTCNRKAAEEELEERFREVKGRILRRFTSTLSSSYLADEGEGGDKGVNSTWGGTESAEMAIASSSCSAEMEIAEQEHSMALRRVEKTFPDDKAKMQNNQQRMDNISRTAWNRSADSRQNEKNTAMMMMAPPAKRKTSLLRQQISPLDVVCKWEINWTAIGGSWEWEEGWKSLEDEIREDREAEGEDEVGISGAEEDGWEEEMEEEGLKEILS